jgi:RNA polymerase sigma-70 factor, ECF subfamily
MSAVVSAAIEAAYRSHWGRIVATLIKLLGDFDLAEECVQESFTAAVDQWERDGVPQMPAAWLIQTARHKAIDRIRRRKRYAEKLEEMGALLRISDEPDYYNDDIPDDRLRLIFTCCHPALAPEAQIALTLQTLCGLDTDEIARAFLVPPATMAQRLLRAKRKIRDARVPYIVPPVKEMPARLQSVLTAVYLVFNEGYSATRGDALVRIDLCDEAIRLARLVRSLMAPHPPHEVTGLLALMLLHDARRHARHNTEGDLILLEDQDRGLWNREQIYEGTALAQEAMAGTPGQYALQAAIAATHCGATRAQETNWLEILRLYNLLEKAKPSPVVSLNRAVAVAMVLGVPAALDLIEEIALSGELDRFHLLHSTRAELLRRAGEFADASISYRRALMLVTNEAERRYLQRRLNEVEQAVC